MSADLDLIVPATTRGLQTALQTLEESCAARNVQFDLQSRARIVVEELFTNTIKYGYGGESELPVRLSGMAASALTLTFEDDAPPFDLTAWSPPLQSPGERPVGQAGISMVMGLCAAVSYARVGESNRVTLTIVAH